MDTINEMVDDVINEQVALWKKTMSPYEAMAALVDVRFIKGDPTWQDVAKKADDKYRELMMLPSRSR